MIGFPVGASVRPLANPAARVNETVVVARSIDDGKAMEASLSRDVARHPGDFIVFETEAGAKEFLARHRADVQRETNSRIASRGVVGYWQGKTIVVLPWWGAAKNFQ